MVDLASMWSEGKAGRLWVRGLERRLGGVRDRVGILFIGFISANCWATPRILSKSSPVANAACLYVYHYAHSLATIMSLYESVSRTSRPSLISGLNDEVCRCTIAFDGLQTLSSSLHPPFSHRASAGGTALCYSAITWEFRLVR